MYVACFFYCFTWRDLSKQKVPNQYRYASYNFRFFTYETDGSIRKLYEIVDGKQRLNALMEFFEGRFKFKGLYFREMHVFDQNHFENYPVSVGECENISRAQILKYFLKLNVSGKPQDPNHLEFVRKLYWKSMK